jgi:hypothetical protein
MKRREVRRRRDDLLVRLGDELKMPALVVAQSLVIVLSLG